jgi:hypothetical protein
MFPAGVVEAVDVLKEGIGDLVARSPCKSPDQFCFEGFKEGLDGGIVVAATSATHRYFEAQLTQSLLIVMRTILTSPIRVMDAAWWRVSKRHCIVQSLQRQIAFQAIANGSLARQVIAKQSPRGGR